MKKLIKEYAELQVKAKKLEDQLNASIQLTKDMEEAYNKLVTKYDLVLASHHVTTQIFSHQQGATWKIKYIQATEQKNFKVI